MRNGDGTGARTVAVSIVVVSLLSQAWILTFLWAYAGGADIPPWYYGFQARWFVVCFSPELIAIVAIICSVASLFALFELGATRWTTSLNILALVLVVLAVKARRSLSDSGH